MEFKGTKGNWEIVFGKKDVFAKIKIGDGFLDFRSLSLDSTRYKEENANALLISKAPQMLEMLNRIMKNYDKGTQTYLDCQKLIKEATEL